MIQLLVQFTLLDARSFTENNGTVYINKQKYETFHFLKLVWVRVAGVTARGAHFYEKCSSHRSNSI